jgi:hypothetical protein
VRDRKTGSRSPPQTKCEVERCNRTLLAEWAYLRPCTSNGERGAALADSFLHAYTYHRCLTVLGGQPPINRVNKTAGQYSEDRSVAARLWSIHWRQAPQQPRRQGPHPRSFH